MAKRKPYNQLTIGFQSRPAQTSNFKFKDNIGLDTETYKGYVRLIADNTGDYKEVDNITEILQFMTRNKYRSSFNWFYNIRYDFESIVKYLEPELLYELYNEGKVNYEHYKLTYFPSKLFSIGNEKHSYTFYDLFNFLETSLDIASKTYLGLEKLKEVDANKLNTDWQYWIDNLPNIIKYCKYDAYLTKLLADYFWQMIYKTINFYPKRPISKGKLSEEYFLNTCYIPIIKDIPSPVLEMAYKNYVGGRFELIKKGYFPSVYIYDIKSAYPYEMTKLIDYSNGKWSKIKNKRFNSDADYGFYHCQINTLEPFFSPFCIKRNGLNIYPIGRFNQFLNYDEIIFIKENYTRTKITVLNGYEFTTSLATYPFKEEIERLYAWKERETDEAIKYCVKIILNSLYGKTIQTVGGRTGKLFNPIYATKTTSNTRLALQKLALQSPENIIQFSTDSIASTVPLKVPDNPKLGDFSYEFSGQGIYAISDIYSLWNNKKIKDKFRGFNKVKDTVFNIFESLNLDTSNKTLVDILKTMQFSTKYKYSKGRPYHLGECLLHTDTRSLEDINIFHTETKIIDINSDAKRFWLREFKDGRDCMTNNINSYPLKFN